MTTSAAPALSSMEAPMHRDERVTDEMISVALIAFQSGDMDWSSQDEELMRFALEEAIDAMPKQKPVSHLVWRQYLRAADDVEDYYEVARPGDKCVDGSEPFPVYAHPPRSALVNAQADADVVERWQPIIERLCSALDAAETYVIDGVTNAKQQLEMNEAYPSRKSRFERDLREAREIFAECQASRRAALRSSGSAEVGSATDTSGKAG